MLKRKEHRIHRISKDFFYNIVASFLLTGVMQLIVYPSLALRFDEAQYGTILTAMGVVNTIIVTFGNTLNNARLVTNSEYEQRNQVGDYQLLLIVASVLGGISSCFCLMIIPGISYLSCVLMCITVVAGVIKSYYCVGFRIILDFRKTLFQNMLGAVGYCLGVFLLPYYQEWALPFFVAELAQLFYVILYSPVRSEPFKMTALFRSAISKYLILIVTGLFSSLIMYMDRLLIYPLLGAEKVSIYTTASVFGKTLGIIMTPISGVLLGYYAQVSFQMDKAKFRIINLVAILGGIVFACMATYVSPIVTKVLYPTIYEKAKGFLFLANLSATISVVCSVTQTAVLRYAPTWIQIVKETLYGVVYIIFGVAMLKSMGLKGFCYAAIISNAIKLLVLCVAGELFIKDSTYPRK